jgi:hypothetical protein
MNSELHRHVWIWSLLSFILAALTGFLYRYGMFYPVPGELSFANIRHAHSHLMFFNWAVPPLMLRMMAAVSDSADLRLVRKVRAWLYTMLFLGFVSYPLFLMHGYRPVAIGSASLPLAAIVSGFIMLTWYGIAWIYFSRRRLSPNRLVLMFYDAAMAALVVSSMGAWGVTVAQFSASNIPLLSTALTHFFLAVFTQGWVLIAVFGILWEAAEKPGKMQRLPIAPGWLWLPLLIGSMLIFPYSLNQSVITPVMQITARVGLLLISLGMVNNLWLLYRAGIFTGFVLRVTALLIGLTALFQIIVTMPIGIWPGEHGLRVLYLHLLLLGIATPVTVLRCHVAPGSRSITVLSVTIIALLVTLVLISGYWPSVLTIPNTFHIVMIVAVLPVLPAGWIFYEALVKR